MPTVVGVRFRSAGKLYHFDPGGLDCSRLDRVVVETANGTEIGRVVTEAMDKPAEDMNLPLRRILRKATTEDRDRQSQNRTLADDALMLCKRRVQEIGLAMKPVEAEMAFDGSRVTISFTADDRIDFRDLVRDLTQRLHAKIEMRQIGARDEAKVLDGIGPCGQQLCCTRWLTEFKPISIKMAKLQGLALNPGKLAGVCGRLKCCLRYEIENYAEGEKPMPNIGATVHTSEGEGRVVGVSVLSRKVSVLLDDGAKWFSVDEVFGGNGCGSGGGGGSGNGGCSCGRG
ncbi:MAG TPA: regulatory iron-sulfur-containing complex subunit RicT [Bacillota bacterium]|nr:regulatory iron-sulfur-containing complex subunit RicT [Bacillota bacterium]